MHLCIPVILDTKIVILVTLLTPTYTQGPMLETFFVSRRIGNSLFLYLRDLGMILACCHYTPRLKVLPLSHVQVSRL